MQTEQLCNRLLGPGSSLAEPSDLTSHLSFFLSFNQRQVEQKSRTMPSRFLSLRRWGPTSRNTPKCGDSVACDVTVKCSPHTRARNNDNMCDEGVLLKNETRLLSTLISGATFPAYTNELPRCQRGNPVQRSHCTNRSCKSVWNTENSCECDTV